MQGAGDGETGSGGGERGERPLGMTINISDSS